MFHPTLVTADAISWLPADETTPGSRYLAILVIAGYPMHLEARQLTRNTDSEAEADSSDYDGFVEWSEDLAALQQLYPDVTFQDATAQQLGINDPNAAGTYLLFAYPFEA